MLFRSWQYQWLNPGDNPDIKAERLDWIAAEPGRCQTMAQRIEELEAYHYKGKKVYATRALCVKETK